MELILAGTGLLIAILFALFLVRRRSHGRRLSPEAQPDKVSQWMRVILLDSEGTVMRKEWSRIKEPARFPVNGLSHVGEYTARLIESTASFPTLSFFTPDGMRGVSACRKDGEVSIHLVFKRSDRKREARARVLLEALNLVPFEDRIAADGVRLLAYPIHEETEVSDVCTRLLTEVFDVAPAEPLHITFEERELQCSDR